MARVRRLSNSAAKIDTMLEEQAQLVSELSAKLREASNLTFRLERLSTLIARVNEGDEVPFEPRPKAKPDGKADGQASL